MTDRINNWIEEASPEELEKAVEEANNEDEKRFIEEQIRYRNGLED